MTDETNVIKFPGVTMADHQPEVILDAAKGKGDYCLVIIDGPDGEYFASSSSDAEKAVFMAQRAIHFFMKHFDEAE